MRELTIRIDSREYKTSGDTQYDLTVSLSLPPSFDYCPGCTEDGKCARCGGSLTNPEDAERPYTVCGWDFDDHIPEPYECDCWYLDLN